MTASLRYLVQVKHGDRWVTVCSEDSRSFCQGYLARVFDVPGVRLGWRLYDSKRERVLSELRPQADVSLGQVAGWPSAEQYEAAAARAMEQAQRIRSANLTTDGDGDGDGERQRSAVVPD